MLDPVGLIPLYLALGCDIVCGDPPNRFHPVAWMGRLISVADRLAAGLRPVAAFALGLLLVVLGAAAMAAVGSGIAWLVARLPLFIAWPLTALVLKSTFSIRALVHAAAQVRDALAGGDLAAARALVSRHLVSRDTRELSATAVAAATVESVAENTSDSFVAPLFYYAVGGLPAVLVYRFVNTADAMIGYRTPRHEWLGKAAARLDDLANFVPARLTAWLMVLAAPLAHGSAARGWTIWRRDARLTASPNAGHPMSMAAGVLGIELAKAGHYTLGAGQAAADAADITRSIRLCWASIALSVMLVTAVELIFRI